MNDEQFGENMEQDTSDAVIKFKDAVSEEKISVSAYLHSIKIWIHYRSEPRCFLKYGLRQITEQYPQKVIVSRPSEISFHQRSQDLA